MLAACLSSGSHNATMFSDEQPRMSLAALPPAPMDAIFSFSLGDLYPSARNDPDRPKPARGTVAAKLPKKKYRREKLLCDMAKVTSNRILPRAADRRKMPLKLDATVPISAVKGRS